MSCYVRTDSTYSAILTACCARTHRTYSVLANLNVSNRAVQIRQTEIDVITALRIAMRVDPTQVYLRGFACLYVVLPLITLQ